MATIDRVGGLALVVLALGVVWEARTLPFGTLHNPGPGFAPTLLAVALGVFAILIIAVGGHSPPLSALTWGEGTHALAILGASAFAALILERLGYRLTMLLVLVFLLGVVERKRPLTVAALSLVLSFGSFYLFHNLLKVQLPRGPLGF